MAEGGFDEFERNQEQDREWQETDVDRTADTDNNILIKPTKTSTRVDFLNDNDLSGFKKDLGSIKKSITNDVKKSFKKIFDMNVDKKNGPNSRMILDYTRFLTDTSGTTYIEYKDKRIGKVGKNLEPILFTRKNGKFVVEFKDNMFNVDKEYRRTPSALVEDMFESDLPADVTDDILDSSIERVTQSVNEISERINSEGLTGQDMREFAGVLDPKGVTAQDKIAALEIQADHWNDRAKEAGPEKERLYKSLESVARLQADNIRLRNNERPIHDETVDIINEETKESDLGRLERFKNWAKENLVGLSAIAITIAGIVTTVVIAGRKTFKHAAHATGKLAKALVNIGKKLGPLIAPILNLLAQAISWGAKGIEFLSRNLWMLSIALAYFMYSRIRS